MTLDNPYMFTRALQARIDEIGRQMANLYMLFNFPHVTITENEDGSREVTMTSVWHDQRAQRTYESMAEVLIMLQTQLARAHLKYQLEAGALWESQYEPDRFTKRRALWEFEHEPNHFKPSRKVTLHGPLQSPEERES